MANAGVSRPGQEWVEGLCRGPRYEAGPNRGPRYEAGPNRGPRYEAGPDRGPRYEAKFTCVQYYITTRGGQHEAYTYVALKIKVSCYNQEMGMSRLNDMCTLGTTWSNFIANCIPTT